MTRLQEKVRGIGNYLQRSYYLNFSNVEVDGWQTNDCILFPSSPP